MILTELIAKFKILLRVPFKNVLRYILHLSDIHILKIVTKKKHLKNVLMLHVSCLNVLEKRVVPCQYVKKFRLIVSCCASDLCRNSTYSEYDTT